MMLKKGLILFLVQQLVVGSQFLTYGTPLKGAIVLTNNMDPNKIRVGTEIEMHCDAGEFSIKEPSFDVNKMVIKAGSKVMPTKVLSPETISCRQVINFGSPQQFKCCHGTELLAILNIRYGAPPPEPRSEGMVIYNWGKAEASFGPPVSDMKRITGEQFLPNITIYHTHDKRLKRCDRIEGYKCFISAISFIDANDSFYYFYVQFSNAFNNSSFKRFNVTKKVKPKPVEESSIAVKVVNSSLEINWNTPYNYEDCCWYTVKLKATNLNHQVSRDTQNRSSTFTNLYPHGKYNITLFARPKVGGILSDPTRTFVEMPEAAPAANPEFIPGAVFSLPCGVNCRKVTLYWKEMQEEMKNGVITDLILDVVIGDKVVRSRRLPGNSTSCEIDRLSSTQSYEMRLRAATANGMNDKIAPSVVQVGKKSNDLKCLVTNVVAILDKGSHLVEVTWDYRNSCNASEDDVNHTAVYFCLLNNNFQKCQGQLRFHTMPANASHAKVKLPTDDLYRICVAKVKNGQEESRMACSRCLYRHGAVPVKDPRGDIASDNGKIKFYLKNYTCDESAGIIKELRFNICKAENGGGCKGTVHIESKPVDKKYLYQEAVFEVPVPEYNKNYSVLLVATTDGGQSPSRQEYIYVTDPRTDGGRILAVAVSVPVALVVIISVAIFCWCKLRSRKQEKLAFSILPSAADPNVFKDQQKEQLYEVLPGGHDVASSKHALCLDFLGETLLDSEMNDPKIGKSVKMETSGRTESDAPDYMTVTLKNDIMKSVGNSSYGAIHVDDGIDISHSRPTDPELLSEEQGDSRSVSLTPNSPCNISLGSCGESCDCHTSNDSTLNSLGYPNQIDCTRRSRSLKEVMNLGDSVDDCCRNGDPEYCGVESDNDRQCGDLLSLHGSDEEDCSNIASASCGRESASDGHFSGRSAEDTSGASSRNYRDMIRESDNDRQYVDRQNLNNSDGEDGSNVTSADYSEESTSNGHSSGDSDRNYRDMNPGQEYKDFFNSGTTSGSTAVSDSGTGGDNREYCDAVTRKTGTKACGKLFPQLHHLSPPNC